MKALIFCCLKGWHLSKERQSFADTVLCQSGNSVNIEFIHDLFTMRLDGLFADCQNCSNLFRLVTLCDQAHDLQLSAGQPRRVGNIL
jgi:hypothetical protein